MVHGGPAAIASLVLYRGDMLFAMNDKAGRNKRSVFGALAVLAMGVPPFVNSLGNPRLAGLRGPDVMQLIAIGFCVGGSLGVFLVGVLGGRRSA